VSQDQLDHDIVGCAGETMARISGSFSAVGRVDVMRRQVELSRLVAGMAALDVGPMHPFLRRS